MSVRNEIKFALAQWVDSCRRRMGISLYHYSDIALEESAEVVDFALQLGIQASVIWTGNQLNIWRFKCRTTDQRLMAKLRWGKSSIWEILRSDRDDH